MLRYVLVPIGIVVCSVPRYVPLFGTLSEDFAATCAKDASAIESLVCIMHSFFGQTLSTSFGSAYMATLFAFIAAALTVTHLESARIFNRGSFIIRHPLFTWVSVNLITGDVTFPCLYAATLWYQASRSALGAPGKATRQAGNRLASITDTYSIPAAVLIGFVLPCTLLLFSSSQAATVIWNLFPVWVSGVRSITSRILSRTAFRTHVEPVAMSDHPAAMLRVYVAPVLLSLVAHVWLLSSLDSYRGLLPALEVMVINGLSCFVMFAYWIFYEGSWNALTSAVLCSVIAGPGAGLCVGWAMQEHVSSF